MLLSKIVWCFNKNENAICMLFKIILTQKEGIIQSKYSKTDDYKKKTIKFHPFIIIFGCLVIFNYKTSFS